MRWGSRGARSAAVAVLAVLAAACGEASRENAARPASPMTTSVVTHPPPAIVPVAPPGTGALDPNLGPVVVTAPCPGADPSFTGGPEMLTESSRLEPMLGHVLAYGSAHPEEFGTYGLLWHDSGDASVFASFTGRLDEHRAALHDVVPFPDELVVCQAALTDPDADALAAQLTAELEGRYLGIGRGGGSGIDVTLRAGEAELAADLRERYGDAVELTVGALAYPIERAVASCGPPPVGADLDGLTIATDSPSTPLPTRGEPLELSVTLTNAGDSRIHFLTGTATGALLDGAGRVVNADVGGQLLAATSVDLAPGASMQLPLTVSTASCDPALGYVVPPGEYELIVTIDRADASRTSITADPVRVTLSG